MKRIQLCLLTSLLVLAACSKDGDTIDRSKITMESITRLERLPATVEYEVWLVSGEENISLGKYNNLSDGQEFFALTGQVDAATGIKISIEEGNDDSEAISNTVILSGDFNGNSADLSINSTLGSFANASGVFTLWTPTDDNPDNNQNGVWFLDPNNGNPQPGLNLPSLPVGWRYEGWVEVPNASNQLVNLSTGRFSSASGSDETAAYDSEINPKPAFPGEDFVNLNLLSQIGFNGRPDLRLKKIFISVEPEPDFNVSEPFVIQPLVNPQTSNTLYPGTQGMQLNTISFPRAVVSRE